MGRLDKDAHGIVVPFRRPIVADDGTDDGAQIRVHNRLDMGDRIELLRWSRTASGVRRVRVEKPEPEDDPIIGEFVLIYGEDEHWARWGVARDADGYELWSPSSGRTAGRFPSLREALTAIGQAG